MKSKSAPHYRDLWASGVFYSNISIAQASFTSPNSTTPVDILVKRVPQEFYGQQTTMNAELASVVIMFFDKMVVHVDF